MFDHHRGSHVEIDGARIYHESIGNDAQPTLLFLHGGFGNIEDFNPVLANVGREFRVIGIDSRGHGKSTLGAVDLTYERLQQDVERILKHLRVGRLSIIGLSDGGIVALRLAAMSGLQIEKVIVIGARGHSQNIGPVRELLAGVTGDSWRKKFPATYDSYQRLNPEPNFNLLARQAVAMWLDTSASGYPNERVRDIACPLLVVRGDEDHLVSREAAVELADSVGKASLLNFHLPVTLRSRTARRCLKMLSGGSSPRRAR